MIRNQWVRVVLAACALVVSDVAVGAKSVLLTMDDLPNQPLNNLVHPEGVTFRFTVNGQPSSDAEYNSGGPGSLSFVQDPSIEGTASGMVTMEFATPITMLQFGAAVSSEENHIDGGVVELFSPWNVSLGTGNFDMTLISGDPFPNGQFNYSGAPVIRADVSFDLANAPRFVLDNLAFTTVPEPSSSALLAIGTATLAWIAARRRRTLA